MMSELPPIRVVLLIARPEGPMARIAHYLARVGRPEIALVGAVVDRHHTAPAWRHRRARLATWRRHGGIGYMTWRLALPILSRFQTALPASRYARSLASLGDEFGFPVIDVASANSADCRRWLADFGADVGLSVQNRMLERATFTIPRLGFVKVHYGEIPAYRGLPPAFWELHDEAPQMG